MQVGEENDLARRSGDGVKRRTMGEVYVDHFEKGRSSEDIEETSVGAVDGMPYGYHGIHGYLQCR